MSLDSLDESTFKEMSGKDFAVEKVLKGIQSAIDSGFTGIKINCVVKKGSNEDSILDLVDYCKKNFCKKITNFFFCNKFESPKKQIKNKQKNNKTYRLE